MSVSSLRSHFLSADPLFSSTDETAHLLGSTASTWDAAVAILETAQRRCEELDDAAGARGAELLSRLADRPPDTGHAAQSLQFAVEHVIAGIARADEAADASHEAKPMANGLRTLLCQSVAGGGALALIVGSALAAYAGRGECDYELVCPMLLCAAGSITELTRVISGAHLLLSALEHTLKSCSDQKLRLRAVKCCEALWTRAQARWPGELARDPYSDAARGLATHLINCSVDTAVYDSVCKLRLAATNVLLLLSPALDAMQALKCAMLKVRDKDKAVRIAALRVCALIGGDDGAARHLSAQHVQQIILHGSADGMPEEQRAFAADTFLGFMVVRQAQPLEALSELHVESQLPLYTPLLKMHIGPIFAASLPNGPPVPGATEEA
jgi:hypothetical protein